MDFDIYNREERPVVCVSNEDLGWWKCRYNAPLLTVGNTYTVSNVRVYDWHTEVYLKELPDLTFNSVLFEEIDI